jgi:hypothetical protein
LSGLFILGYVHQIPIPLWFLFVLVVIHSMRRSIIQHIHLVTRSMLSQHLLLMVFFFTNFFLVAFMPIFFHFHFVKTFLFDVVYCSLFIQTVCKRIFSSCQNK